MSKKSHVHTPEAGAERWRRRVDNAAAADARAVAAQAQLRAAQLTTATRGEEEAQCRSVVKAARQQLADSERALARATRSSKSARQDVKRAKEVLRSANRTATRAHAKLADTPEPEPARTALPGVDVPVIDVSGADATAVGSAASVRRPRRPAAATSRRRELADSVSAGVGAGARAASSPSSGAGARRTRRPVTSAVTPDEPDPQAPPS